MLWLLFLVFEFVSGIARVFERSPELMNCSRLEVCGRIVFELFDRRREVVETGGHFVKLV
jgi:hypothetical protein